MKLFTRAYELILEKNQTQDIKETLLNFLSELLKLESKLWGVSFKQLQTQEEVILEDSNHLIYLFNKHSKEGLKELLTKKETKIFLDDLRKVHTDFLYLKKQINQKNYLKNLITEYSIKCVDLNDFDKLEMIFLLEKQLFEVLDKQQNEIQEFFDDANQLRIKKKDDDTVEDLVGALKRIRKILSGHLDHHELWEEERIGYSNISNILHALIKEVKNS